MSHCFGHLFHCHNFLWKKYLKGNWNNVLRSPFKCFSYLTFIYLFKFTYFGGKKKVKRKKTKAILRFHKSAHEISRNHLNIWFLSTSVLWVEYPSFQLQTGHEVSDKCLAQQRTLCCARIWFSFFIQSLLLRSVLQAIYF